VAEALRNLSHALAQLANALDVYPNRESDRDLNDQSNPTSD